MTLDLYRLQPAGSLIIRDPDRTWLRSDVAALVRGAALRVPSAQVKILDGSKEGGGLFETLGSGPPHKSHRVGRDLDIRSPLDVRPGDDVAVLALTQALAPAFETVGSTYPINVTGTKVSPWPGHTKHLHYRFTKAPLSARIASATLAVKLKPTERAKRALQVLADMGTMALEGHETGSQVARALATAWLLDAIADPVGAAMDGPKAAAALRALALVLGDWDTTTMEVATAPWLDVKATEVVKEAAKLALKGVGAGVGLAGAVLAPLAFPVAAVVAIVVVLAVIIGAVMYAGRNPPSGGKKRAPPTPSTSAPAEWDEYALPELRSAHAKFVSPPGRRNRESLIANLEAKGVTEAQVSKWMKGR